jgi:MAF protein
MSLAANGITARGLRLILASASPRRRELLTQAGYSFLVDAADVDESLRAGEEAGAYVQRLAVEKAQAVFARHSSAPHPTHRGEAAMDGAPSAQDVGAPSMTVSSSWVGSAKLEHLHHYCNATKSCHSERSEESPHFARSETHFAIAEPALIVLGADTSVVLGEEILGKPADAADARRMLQRLSGKTHRVLTGIAAMTTAGVLSAVESTEVVFANISDADLDTYCATAEPLDKAGAYGIQGYAARWIPRIDGCYFNVMGLPIARVVRLIDEALANCR